MNRKWLYTMSAYDEYERRFAEARAKKELRFPTTDAVREKILSETKRTLGWSDELVPTVHNMIEISRTNHGSYDAVQCRYESWDNCFVPATMYMPCEGDNLPLVMLFPGHGNDGRLTRSYRLMAHRLAQSGVCVMVPDNLGQGDRNFYGDAPNPDHTHCITPFYCGLTLQGLIVMESVALIRYMTKHERIDPARIGSCGNSGGGTLNLFLAAMAPELACVVSTGYPCGFHYILEKERFHCACNLLPGIAYGPEMWEVLSLAAPKPLMIEQGLYDDLISIDYAYRCARKLKNVYIQYGAEKNFRQTITKTTHPWAEEDVSVVGKFLSEHLGFVFAEPSGDPTAEYDVGPWHVKLPDSGLHTTALAEMLTGVSMPNGTELHDIFVPKIKGAPLERELIEPDLGRGSVMRVLSQFECALTEDWNPMT